MTRQNLSKILAQVGRATESVSFWVIEPGGARGMDRLFKAPLMIHIFFVMVGLLLPVSSVSAQISLSISDSTFAFGTNVLNAWLTPQSSVITNDGNVAEDFIGKISQFTDASNTWVISSSANGADTVRAQWSITSEDGPWTDISDYDTDFTIVTNVAVNDSVTFWFRIETPTSVSSYDEHSSTLTVTAQEY